MLGFVSKTLLSSCDGVIPLRKNLRATSFIHDVKRQHCQGSASPMWQCMLNCARGHKVWKTEASRTLSASRALLTWKGPRTRTNMAVSSKFKSPNCFSLFIQRSTSRPLCEYVKWTREMQWGKKRAKWNAEKNRNPKLMMIFTELELIL